MGSEQATLPGLALSQGSCSPQDGGSSSKEDMGNEAGKPRFKRIDREQLFWRMVDLDRLIADDHPVRAIWELVGKMDLSRFDEKIRAVEGVAGRSPYDPRLLISLWIYAYSQGVNSARAIERLCEIAPPYQWLTGLEVVNAHTLSDFRVGHGDELKELFVQVLALLSSDGMITLERVMQDGTKIKASAAPDSFRTEEKIQEQLKAVQEHVEALDKLTEEESSERAAKARERGRRERSERLESALREFDKLRAEGNAKERVSITDPEARNMKQAGGGFAPSYNVQISTDAANKVIVGVGITQAGNDFDQLIPGVERVEQNLAESPKQVVADGGFVSRDNIVEMESRGVDFIGPQCEEEGKGKSSYEGRGVTSEYLSSRFVYDAASDSFRCPQDKTLSYEGKDERNLHVSYKYRATWADCKACPAKGQCCPGNQVTGRSVQRTEELPEVAAFRQKMKTEPVAEIYHQRSEVAETPNLWIKAKFGLRQFRLRGICKVEMETLWACLTYNIRLWIRLHWKMRAAAAVAMA
jgi:transposase